MRDEHKGRALPHPCAAPGYMVHPHSLLTGILNSSSTHKRRELCCACRFLTGKAFWQYVTR